MATENSLNQEQKMKSAMLSKWPKISTPEVTEIMGRHNTLTEILKNKYAMAPDVAKKECEAFFKKFNAKKEPDGFKKCIK